MSSLTDFVHVNEAVELSALYWRKTHEDSIN